MQAELPTTNDTNGHILHGDVQGDAAIELPQGGLPLFVENMTFMGTRPRSTVTAGGVVWLDSATEEVER